MTIPEDIERVALLGWAVFPASQYSRASCFSGAHDAATSDLDTISGWCRDYPSCNWRLAFGLSQLWGLDIDAISEDHAADGIGAMRNLTAINGALAGDGKAIWDQDHAARPVVCANPGDRDEPRGSGLG